MFKKTFILFMAICLHSLVKAEVVELTQHDNPQNHYTIQDQGGFTTLLGDIHYWNNPNFSDYVNGLLPHGQMPGFAAFLPVGNAEHAIGQVFAAKKQNPNNLPGHPIPEYNFLEVLNAIQNNVPNVNAFHTERQLVSHILGGQPNDISGIFLIFTRSQPCPIGGNDNGNTSCYEFYLDLANHFPNINFHIYTERDFDINLERVAPKRYQNQLPLLYAQRFEQLRQLILAHIQEAPQNAIEGVVENQGEISLILPNGEQKVIDHHGQGQDNSRRRALINKINRSFTTRHPNDWRELKENIINGHYSGNHDRIHYHVR